MAMSDSLAGFPALSPTSDVIFTTQGQISRWSNTGVPLDGCAAIVAPSTEEDIAAVVAFAAQNDLTILPIAGKHGNFLPIDQRSIYLDLKNFGSVELDEEEGCVKVGGGVVAGHLCRALAEKGWYTSHPNSNAVGMVGYVLGGGSSTINGIHSLAIDNLLAVRILTASGSFLTLSPHSLGLEKDLYNVICGAGFGFGVVTSITLKAWRIADLGLNNDNVWTRRVVFPQSAIDVASDLFVQFLDPSPQTAAALLFLRAPPSAPLPGAPVVMLIITHFGPASSAEELCEAAFDPAYIGKATVANTTFSDFASLNVSTDVLNRHGDYKSNYSTWAHTITSEQIRSGFERWLQLGQEVPDAQPTSYFVISARNPACMLAHDRDDEKFFPRTIRERTIFAQAVPWWTDARNEGECRSWGRDMLSILGNRLDSEEKVNGFAANFNQDIDITEVWPHEKVAMIRSMKAIWDPENVFWSPVMNGM